MHQREASTYGFSWRLVSTYHVRQGSLGCHSRQRHLPPGAVSPAAGFRFVHRRLRLLERRRRWFDVRCEKNQLTCSYAVWYSRWSNSRQQWSVSDDDLTARVTNRDGVYVGMRRKTQAFESRPRIRIPVVVLKWLSRFEEIGHYCWVVDASCSFVNYTN